MSPVSDVRRYMFTDRPLLAADATLAPWPAPSDLQVMQTGAWMLADPRALSAELEAFLAAGEPPIYFGFGSVHTPQETGGTAIEAARALGRRAIVLSGWAGLRLVDDQADCLSVSEVNLQTLFPQVAAVVHHGGAGTTTIAARAGAPQVVVPHVYDQRYFAGRVSQLGIGVSQAPTAPTSRLARRCSGPCPRTCDGETREVSRCRGALGRRRKRRGNRDEIPCVVNPAGCYRLSLSRSSQEGP